MRIPSFAMTRWRQARDRSSDLSEVANRGRTAAVEVLYIGGCQRSGSTLLDRMLGQTHGHVSAGEITHLWTRGLSANDLCGCGERFADCPFWTEVGSVAFGGWAALDAAETLDLQHRVDRNRYIIFMLWPVLSSRYRRDLARYVAILDRLYQAIRQVGGDAVVVDSSKHASTAFLLRRVPSVRLRVVHLVRDSRGVAFSLLKKVRRPEALDGALMFRASPWRAGAEWSAFNGLFHILGMTGIPRTLVRYETLVRRPRETLAGILSFGRASAEREDPLTFIDGSSVALGVDHSVAGNPMRMKHGSFELRVDTEWRTSMLPRDRRITTFMTWPLLARYGYRRSDRR
jgi:hypothetical protein